jgi:hypothetical protein
MHVNEQITNQSLFFVQISNNSGHLLLPILLKTHPSRLKTGFIFFIRAYDNGVYGQIMEDLMKLKIKYCSKDDPAIGTRKSAVGDP